MCHPADADEFLEVSSDELRTVVADDPGSNSRVALESALGNRFNVAFFHLRANLPMHNRSAKAVKQAAKEEECPPHVDIGNVDVPVFVRTERLLKSHPLERHLGIVPLHQPGVAEHSVDAGGAGCRYIGVKHHEGETAVALKGDSVVKLDDGLLFPVFEPPVAGNPAIMFVDLAVTLPPVVELALADAQPLDELLGRDLRPIRPVASVIDDLVTGVVGNPGSGQSSPSTFFNLTCSSSSSATTSFLRWSLS
jgi:hypothetical protein